MATWEKRRDIPLTILGWFAVLAIVIQLLSHVGNALFLLTIAGILSYALAPAVKFFDRFLPRTLAIILLYILVTFGIGYLIYLILEIAINQFTLLIATVQTLLTPTGGQKTAPLITYLQKAGFSQQQITDAGKQITTQLEHLASSILPILSNIVNSIIDIFIVMILSIYLLIDGSRSVQWLESNMPVSQRNKLRFMLNTLQRIIGGYIRGQFILSVIIGVLVGFGMFLFQLPYAVLLGLLAFMLSFIPILGTIITGVACVLVGLTKGWIIALLVLGYFILINALEGNILGPKIVGRALGLHPVISLLAVIAGTELFGIKGALFASPVAGMTQALLVAVWTEWKISHPKEFIKQKKKLIKKI